MSAKNFFLASSLLFTLTLPFSFLHAALLFHQPRTLSHDTIIDGQSCIFQLAQQLAIAAHTTLTLRNCILTGVTPQTLHLCDTTSKLILDNSILILDGDYTFACGTIHIHNLSEIRGPGTWRHTSSNALFIAKDSTLLCSNNLLYYYRPTSHTQDRIQCADTSATLMLHNAHLRAGKMGLLLSRGTLCIHELCTAHADNTHPDYGILLGTGRCVEDNMRCVMGSPRARLRIKQRHLRHNIRTHHLAWQALAYCTLAGIGIGIGVL